jgi:hypothetical protein
MVVSMPAIDLTRLSHELDSLGGLVDDPESAVRACLNLLDFYADRTRRPTLRSTADMARKFGAPSPVVRQLARRLALAAINLPDAGERLADALWEADFRETKLAAVAIFEQRADDGVPAWIEAHARTCTDKTVLSALGGQGIRSWRAAHPDAFLERAWSWIDESDSRLMTVAIMALAEAISQPEFPLGPKLFQGLESRFDRLAAQPGRTLGDLLRKLAARSPAETAQMLKYHLTHGKSQRAMAGAVRSSLPSFPARQRRVLEAALSGEEPG